MRKPGLRTQNTPIHIMVGIFFSACSKIKKYPQCSVCEFQLSVYLSVCMFMNSFAKAYSYYVRTQ